MQALAEREELLCGDEVCGGLLREAGSRQRQHCGLLADARPAATQSYIYVHKTEENVEIRHSFCYCLAIDQLRELLQDQGASTMIPDHPVSQLTSDAEKVGCFATHSLQRST